MMGPMTGAILSMPSTVSKLMTTGIFTRATRSPASAQSSAPETVTHGEDAGVPRA